MREGTLRGHFAQPAINARRLEDADHNGEAPDSFDLAQFDQLMVVNLADDDAPKRHLDVHAAFLNPKSLTLSTFYPDPVRRPEETTRS